MTKSTGTRGTLLLYLLRGIAGIGLLADAFWLAEAWSWLAMIAAIGAFVAFRGCPIFWGDLPDIDWA